MAGKKAQDNTKKAAGNARKAESAAKKNAAADAEREVAEDEKWQQGAKNNSKKYVCVYVARWRIPWQWARLVQLLATCPEKKKKFTPLSPRPGMIHTSCFSLSDAHRHRMSVPFADIGFSPGTQRPPRRPRPRKRRLKKMHWPRRRRPA